MSFNSQIINYLEGYKLVYLIDILPLDIKHKIYRYLREDFFRKRCIHIMKNGPRKGEYCYTKIKRKGPFPFCYEHKYRRDAEDYLANYWTNQDKKNIATDKYMGYGIFWNKDYNNLFLLYLPVTKKEIHDIFLQEHLTFNGESDRHLKIICQIDNINEQSAKRIMN